MNLTEATNKGQSCRNSLSCLLWQLSKMPIIQIFWHFRESYINLLFYFFFPSFIYWTWHIFPSPPQKWNLWTDPLTWEQVSKKERITLEIVWKVLIEKFTSGIAGKIIESGTPCLMIYYLFVTNVKICIGFRWRGIV